MEQTLFYDAPPPPMPARLVTLSQGPLTVRWTGEPLWAPVHWQTNGPRGRSMPCEREQCRVCRIHATPITWHAFVPAIRPKAPAVSRSRSAATCDEEDAARVRRFTALPEEARALLLAEAWSRHPELQRMGAAPNGLVHRTYAAALMPAPTGPARDDPRATPAIDAPAPVALEAIVVDLPDGCAYELIELYEGRPWRGQKCRLRRPPHRGAKTAIELIDEPAVLLPEPVSVRASLCRLWGYQLNEAAETVETDRSVLAFRKQFA